MAGGSFVDAEVCFMERGVVFGGSNYLLLPLLLSRPGVGLYGLLERR